MHKENRINIQCIRRQPALAEEKNLERKTVHRGREVSGSLAEGDPCSIQAEGTQPVPGPWDGNALGLFKDQGGGQYESKMECR